MAKSQRSKWKQSRRKERREKFDERNKVKLEKMIERAKQNQDVEMKTVSEIKEEVSTKSEFNSKTMRNKHGNYPTWLSSKKKNKLIKKSRNAKNKEKAKKKKKNRS